MIINPKEIVEKGYIENMEGGNFEVQQNGIDITLGSAEIINGGFLGVDKREVKSYTEMLLDPENNYHFSPEYAYSVNFQQSIKVPDNMCAQIVQRSTLNRMGAFIVSGVYDSGFNNIIGAVLRTSAPVVIEKGARIAQIVFTKADPASLYSGIYQGK